METNDLAAIGYASQMLAFAVLSTLFLRWRTAGPYSRYLGVASAASSLAGGAIESDPWAARGFVNALVVVPLALSSRRTEFEAIADIPRNIVYYKFSLLAIGSGIALWLMAHDYVGGYGGTSGNVASIVLAAAALCVMDIWLVSATIRNVQQAHSIPDARPE